MSAIYMDPPTIITENEYGNARWVKSNNVTDQIEPDSRSSRNYVGVSSTRNPVSLSDNELTSISKAQLIALSADDIQSLGKRIQKIPPDRCRYFTSIQLKALSETQINCLTRNQLNKMNAVALSDLHTDSLLSERVAAVKKRNIFKIARKASGYFCEKITLSLLMAFPGPKNAIPSKTRIRAFSLVGKAVSLITVIGAVNDLSRAAAKAFK